MTEGGERISGSREVSPSKDGEFEINVVDIKRPTIESLSIIERKSIFNLYGEGLSDFVDLFDDYFGYKEASGNEVIDALALTTLREIGIKPGHREGAIKIIPNNPVHLMTDVYPFISAAGSTITVNEWYLFCEDFYGPLAIDENSHGGVYYPGEEYINLGKDIKKVYEFMQALYMHKKFLPVLGRSVEIPASVKKTGKETLVIKGDEPWLKGDDIKLLGEYGIKKIPILRDALHAELITLAKAYHFFASSLDELRKSKELRDDRDAFDMIDFSWMDRYRMKISMDMADAGYYRGIAKALKLKSYLNEVGKPRERLFKQASSKEQFLELLSREDRKTLEDKINFDNEIIEKERNNNCTHKKGPLRDYLGPVVGDKITCRICQFPIACVHYLDFIKGVALDKYYSYERGNLHNIYCNLCGEQLVDNTLTGVPVERPIEEDIMRIVARQFYQVRNHITLGVLVNEKNFFNMITRGVYDNVARAADNIKRMRGLGETDQENRIAIYAYLNIVSLIVYNMQIGAADIKIHGIDARDARRTPLVIKELVSRAEKDLRVILSSQPTLSIKNMYNEVAISYASGNLTEQKVDGLDKNNLEALFNWFINNPTINPAGKYDVNPDAIYNLIKNNDYSGIKPTSPEHKYWLSVALDYQETMHAIASRKQKEREKKRAEEKTSKKKSDDVKKQKKVREYYENLEFIEADIQLYERREKEHHKFAAETAQYMNAYTKLWALHPCIIFRGHKQAVDLSRYPHELWRNGVKFVFLSKTGNKIITERGGTVVRPFDCKLIDTIDADGVSLSEIVPNKDVFSLMAPLPPLKALPITPPADANKKPATTLNDYGADADKFKPVADFSNQLQLALKKLPGINIHLIEFMADMNGRDSSSVETGRAKYPESANFTVRRVHALKAYFIEHVICEMNRGGEGKPSATIFKPDWWKRTDTETSGLPVDELQKWCEAYIILIIQNIDKKNLNILLQADSSVAKMTGVLSRTFIQLRDRKLGEDTQSDAIGDDIENESKLKAVKGIYDRIDYEGDNDNTDDVRE